jgi:kinetochore protein NDC80
LTKPSAKEFHNIVTFLLRQIDPTFQKSPLRKFEDEVVMSFKTLGYPFNISKTSLVAAGSPHIWPSLLLAITWLMERLELISSANGAVMGGVSGEAGVSVQASDGGLEKEDEFNHVQEYQGLDSIGAAGQPFTTPEAMELRTDRAFLLYVEVAYESFLAGDDETYDALEEELLDYFEKDQMVLEQEIEQVTDENATVVESITNIENEMNE